MASCARQDRFTFAGPDGRRYVMRVLTMGATNSMVALHNTLSDIFGEFYTLGQLIWYADDLLAGAATDDELAAILRRIFEAARRNKLYFHPDKSRLFVCSCVCCGPQAGGGMVASGGKVGVLL